MELSEGSVFGLKGPGDMALEGAGSGRWGHLLGLYIELLTFKNNISFQLVQKLAFLLLIVLVWKVRKRLIIS